jgi:hypothetical protein
MVGTFPTLNLDEESRMVKRKEVTENSAGVDWSVNVRIVMPVASSIDS